MEAHLGGLLWRHLVQHVLGRGVLITADIDHALPHIRRLHMSRCAQPCAGLGNLCMAFPDKIQVTSLIMRQAFPLTLAALVLRSRFYPTDMRSSLPAA